MISTLMLLAASSALQGGPGGAPKAPEAPITFTSKEGGFSIAMPVKPTEAIKEVPTPQGQLVNKIYQATDGKTTFLLICADYPGELPPDQMDGLLNGIKQGYAASTGGEVVEDKKITYQELPGREVVLKIGEAKMRCRYFVKGERIYQIIVVQTDPEADPAVFRRYVDSFKLGKIQGGLKEAPLAAADWKVYRSEAGGFKVRMIGRPVDQAQTVQTPAGPVEMRTCLSNNGLGDSFVVYASPAAEQGPDAKPEAILDSVVDGAIMNQPGSKLVRQKPIKLGTVPGREAEISLPPNAMAEDMTFFVHYYLTKDRLYQVAFIGSKARMAGQPVPEFLGSFELDPGPSQEAKP